MTVDESVPNPARSNRRLFGRSVRLSPVGWRVIRQWWRGFYYIQAAVMMGGVEPFVNAADFVGSSPAELDGDPFLRLAMESYPPRALDLAQKALDLARSAA